MVKNPTKSNDHSWSKIQPTIESPWLKIQAKKVISWLKIQLDEKDLFLEGCLQLASVESICVAADLDDY